MSEVIDRTGLEALIKVGEVQLVDVLPAQEYEEVHLPGAVNIPLKKLTELAALENKEGPASRRLLTRRLVRSFSTSSVPA